ncbi:MAG: Outer membrane lipoprotein carrier protein [uncultured bacterium]|nr:MAG: Outer membrane lipoprotein carrier protein [uncultured bacterium]HBY01200.1 hypothetical protein [Rikenellaceae bacterium]
MKKLLLVFFFLLYTSAALWSQSDIKKLASSEISAFDLKLKIRAENTATLVADFRQEKKMDMLKNKMISKGVFKYKREDKIAFFYSSPMVYHMIINGQWLRAFSNGSNMVFDLNNNPVMKEIRGLISASFTGNLSRAGSNYKIEYFSDSEGIIVSVVPLNRQLASIITEIRIYFSSQNAEIRRLKIEEGSGSTTEYIFSNQRINTDVHDEDFKIS